MMDKLIKYLGFKFAFNWKNSDDYLNFQKIYINYLKYLANKNNWHIIKINKNLFEFSLFMMCNQKLFYFAINDVRFYQDDWFNKILIRTVNSENDYIGNKNYYCKLLDLVDMINMISNHVD